MIIYVFKIPSTVCLVGLKDVPLKPWTPETHLYINSLFENSTNMVLVRSLHVDLIVRNTIVLMIN